MGPNPTWWCPYEREICTHTDRCRKARGCAETSEDSHVQAGEGGLEQILCHSLRWKNPVITWLWTSGLRHCKTIRFCWLSHPVFSTSLLQPWQTNTVLKRLKTSLKCKASCHLVASSKTLWCLWETLCKCHSDALVSYLNITWDLFSIFFCVKCCIDFWGCK